MMRLPILFDLDEVERLHSLAHRTALQTGAKGEDLDRVTSEIFAAMASQANRAEVDAQRRPKLTVVGGAD